MIKLSEYIAAAFPFISSLKPWEICGKAESIIGSLLTELSNAYKLDGGIAVHNTAIIESGTILKPPCLIGPHCFIASNTYLRGGVWLDSGVIIGPSSEIKSSLIFSGSKVAHLNFVGDSIIGRNVNIEAGAIIANYRNEFENNKEIICMVDKTKIKTGTSKFGSLIGDDCKIGANAVLAPGTILKPKTIVKRLTLVDQAPFED